MCCICLAACEAKGETLINEMSLNSPTKQQKLLGKLREQATLKANCFSVTDTELLHNINGNLD